MPVFYDVMRRLLEERLEIARKGETPSFTDIRHFFYETRNKFLRENPQFDEPDTNTKEPYTSFGGMVKDWCVHRAEELGHDPSTYWRVREALNIWAEGRALAEDESGKFLVDRDTRDRVPKGRSFILVCEKKTVSRKLLEELTKAGYKMRVISSAGYSSSDLQEAVMAIAAELDADEPTFYILVLHDDDLDGLEILFNLRDRYANVIDLGVNREFLDYVKEDLGYDARMLEEKNIHKKYEGELRRRILEDDSYALDDFEYLQGHEIEPEIVKGKPKRRWMGKRIEIDAIEVEYGIDPFIKYILQKIEDECQLWDLSRIGVEPFELEVVDHYYEDATEELEGEVAALYDAGNKRIGAPLREIQNIVEDEVSRCPEWVKFAVLKGKVEKNVKKRIEALKKKYPNYERDWSDAYEGDLEEINERIEHYEGDVRKGYEDLKEGVEVLQDSADEDAENDPELKRYKDKLEQIDTREDELKKISKPNRNVEIRAVIKRLERMLT